MVQLKQIAKVQPGYLSRSRVESASDGTHFFIQAKDVSSELGVNLKEAVRFYPQRKVDLYLVSSGDILLAARGQNHQAYLVTKELQNVLASSLFYILRPSKLIRPAYLSWWLNLPETQAQIKTRSRGTGISYIPKRALETLEIEVPPLSVQGRIEKIEALWQKKKILQNQLDQKREELIRAICQQAVLKGME